MGTVYRAFDPRTKRNVAIKTIPRSMWRMKEAFKRFEREAQAVAQLDHPSIVKVLDFGVESGRPYIVMELLVGEDLATTLGRGPLEAAPAVDVALSVCAGVSACHKLGIVHRDIKPRNIFIHRAMFGEVVKVLDFGVSRLPQAAQLTGPADIIGTAGYMSPEQADGRGAGPPSDQYAIGVVLYEMLTGARPFSGKDYEEIRRQILAGRVERPSRRISTIPVELEEVVLPALSREPEARFGSVHEMGAVLLPFASERGKRQWTDFFSAPLAELPQDFSGPTVRRPALSGTPTSSGAPPDRGEDRAAALAAPTIVPAETGAPSPLGAPESRARAIVATAASPEAPVGGGGRSGRRHAVLAAAAASLLGGGLWIWSRGRLEGAQLTRDVPSAQGTGKAPLGPPGAARAGGPSSETSGQSTIDGGPPASGLPNLGAGL
jgi:serine/threonine-protein kinase